MATEPEVREYRPQDAPILNEMLKKVFGIDQDLRMWKWKYEDNPRKEHCSYVAVANEHIIAHSGGIRFDLQIRGEKLLGCQLTDLMSDPDHRIRGAFSSTYLTQFLRNVDDGFSEYGFANPKSTRVITSSELAMPGPAVPRLDRIVNIHPFISRKFKDMSIMRVASTPANMGINLLYSRKLKLRATDAIEEIESFDERFDRLWERIAPQFARTPIRSSAYLEWRYLKHPTQKYKIFALTTDRELQGYIVLRTLEEQDILRGLIMEMVTDLENPRAWESLLGKGISYLVGEKVDLISCWMHKHVPYYRSLKKLGFIERPSDLSVLVHGEVGIHDVDFVNDPKNWYLSMGDSDVW